MRQVVFCAVVISERLAGEIATGAVRIRDDVWLRLGSSVGPLWASLVGDIAAPLPSSVSLILSISSCSVSSSAAASASAEWGCSFLVTLDFFLCGAPILLELGEVFLSI